MTKVDLWGIARKHPIRNWVFGSSLTASRQVETVARGSMGIADPVAVPQYGADGRVILELRDAARETPKALIVLYAAHLMVMQWQDRCITETVIQFTDNPKCPVVVRAAHVSDAYRIVADTQGDRHEYLYKTFPDMDPTLEPEKIFNVSGYDQRQAYIVAALAAQAALRETVAANG